MKNHTYDILNRPLKVHYITKPKDGYSHDSDEIKTIQLLIARRTGIKDGLANGYRRRTYHAEYVNFGKDLRERYIDRVDQIAGRVTISDTTYYCDEHGGNEVIPFIMQLASRHKEQVWIYGYKYSDWDGAVIFLDRYYEAKDALCQAKQVAEREAQICQEEEEKYRAEQRREELFDSLRKLRREIIDLIRTYRAIRPKSQLPLFVHHLEGRAADSVFEALKRRLTMRRDAHSELGEL